MKHAFESIENIDTSELILIDEGSAASIGTIFQGRGEISLKDDYRLLVYDFGGGTIDIVLSHVTEMVKNKIEPLSYSGHPKVWWR